MGKFIIFGVIAYLAIGMIFLRTTVTGMARQRRKDPDYKPDAPVAAVGCFAVFFWPIIPIVLWVIGGVIKDTKKLKEEIDTVESLLADAIGEVKIYENAIANDPTSTLLFEGQLKEAKAKRDKLSEDLTKLKANYEKSKLK